MAPVQLLLLVLATTVNAAVAVPAFNASNDCNRSDVDECLTRIWPLLDNPLVRGIPHTIEAIQASCMAFKAGMTCIDRYQENCVAPKRRAFIESGVAGARYTMAFLCDDEVFQSEYLQHNTCVKDTANDWHNCANHFQAIAEELSASDNLSSQEHNLSLCCAKQGFLRCIYRSSLYKCRKVSSMFLVRVAQTLTDVQVHEDSCRNVSFERVCLANDAAQSQSFSVVCFLLAALLLMFHTFFIVST